MPGVLNPAAVGDAPRQNEDDDRPALASGLTWRRAGKLDRAIGAPAYLAVPDIDRTAGRLIRDWQQAEGTAGRAHRQPRNRAAPMPVWVETWVNLMTISKLLLYQDNI
jgi:hypothetical protein